MIIFLKEINEILGEKLSAEDEEDILAEFENLETEVCDCLLFLTFHILAKDTSGLRVL